MTPMIYFFRCVMRVVLISGVLFLAFLLLAILVVLADAHAEQRTLYGSDGRVIGRADYDSAGNLTLYDEQGRVSGRVTVSSDGSRTIYDRDGRIIGREPGGYIPGKINKDKR